MRARIAECAAATTLSQGSAAAQGLDTWDADASRTINAAEFHNGFGGAGLFNDWIADGDGVIGTAEL